MAFEYFIGARYLRSRQKQAFISFITFLSVAGVTVGVMALIIVIAVMSGAESYFKKQILGVESHVIVRKHNGPIDNYQNIIKELEQIPEITSAAPFVYTQVMLRAPGGLSGAILRGLDPSAKGNPIKGYDRKALKQKLTPQQSAGDEVQVPGIILGQELAAKLGVSKGDMVYLISPRGMMSPIGHMPTMKRFEVTGVFESGFYEYDASLAYIHIQTAQDLLKIGDAATGVGLRIKDIYAADQVSSQISEQLGYPFWTTDWMQMNRNFFSALKLEKKAMFIILTLIILVAAFNIASTLIMMVMGKTRDIAILKAMGATHRSIRKIFVFKGTVIGTIGTALGTVLGIAGCILLKHYKFIELPGDVYYFTTLPIELEFLDVLVIVAAAMAICFLSTIYPAYKASQLNPVEALRYG
ncbi:MAG: lipoprotein-releasing ABC transporter permease subunit [Desulfobacterales bacterium]|nr:lipoprotein-releasing ABC transporter permease subunit [Desulfobacterales bacterium]